MHKPPFSCPFSLDSPQFPETFRTHFRKPPAGRVLAGVFSLHKNDSERPRCGLHEEASGGVYHCLKCGAKGDAVGLVKLARDCEAGEAYAWLRETFHSNGGSVE